jgi:alkylation response protein AidB-like acyl-CoA dehydrogenase
MEFALTAEQLQFQTSLDRALAGFSTIDAVRAATNGDAAASARIAEGVGALGITGVIVPEAHGGLGLDLLDAALVAEMLGRHVTPASFLAASVMAPLALTRAGSEVQQAHWLAKIADGSAHFGVALSEWVNGPRDGAGVTVNGDKLNGVALMAFDAGTADALIVADTSGTLYLVETGAPGLTIEALPSLDTTRPLAKLTFTDSPADPLRGDGPGALAAMRDAAWVLLAADTLGAAQHMLEKAVAYSAERRQFGRAIGSFQAVKHLCAEMAAEIEPCRALVWYAAYALSRGEADGPLAATHAKAHLSEVGRFVARTATEVHGGMGFTDLSGLPFWFRRIEANRQLLGGPEQVRRHAARLQGFAA